MAEGRWATTVAAGEPLLEVETDKGVNPVESVAGGVVLRRLFEDGAKVGAGEVIAWVGQPGDPIPGAASAGAPAAAAHGGGRADHGDRARHAARIAGGAVARRALRRGPRRDPGTGPGGMATREDVLRAKGRGAPAAAQSAAAPLSAVPSRPHGQPGRRGPQGCAELPGETDLPRDGAGRHGRRRGAPRGREAAPGGAPAWDAYLVAAAGQGHRRVPGLPSGGCTARRCASTRPSTWPSRSARPTSCTRPSSAAPTRRRSRRQRPTWRYSPRRRARAASARPTPRRAASS
ncbi:MAG: hypothetical protein MZV70_37305 [Desulfobacterales bacterium]|nr:hypothetical protein [Desulfobacterales bacterium]